MGLVLHGGFQLSAIPIVEALIIMAWPKSKPDDWPQWRRRWRSRNGNPIV